VIFGGSGVTNTTPGSVGPSWLNDIWTFEKEKYWNWRGGSSAINDVWSIVYGKRNEFSSAYQIGPRQSQVSFEYGELVGVWGGIGVLPDNWGFLSGEGLSSSGIHVSNCLFQIFGSITYRQTR